MIKFTKMHGAGNDYIYVYTPECPIENPSEVSVALSRPHFGIGSDGLILIGKSDVADFSMHIYNNDGSEAMMCGNGTRCVGKYVYDHQLTQKTTVTLETLSGIKTIQLHLGADGKVASATVDMGEPQLEVASQFAQHNAIPVGEHVYRVGGTDGFEGTFVSMGNPHFVVFVPEVMDLDIAKLGKQLEFDPAFPQRCNIEFVTQREDGTLRMRVWERGSGITLACGTGACATAVAAMLTGRAQHEANVEMDGGTLHIEWRNDNHIYMTGPAATSFEGTCEDVKI
ncbi:MAG: diaminopimelate epimerase [Bacteroidales bacterium]|nr:diaminopimelate epimerase [Bacteroidales bacterium]